MFCYIGAEILQMRPYFGYSRNAFVLRRPILSKGEKVRCLDNHV